MNLLKDAIVEHCVASLGRLFHLEITALHVYTHNTHLISATLVAKLV